MRIDYLKNNPVFESRLAEISCAEWQHLYGDWNCDAALREFESQRADGSLPLTLVALAREELLGAVSLLTDISAEMVSTRLRRVRHLRSERAPGRASFRRRRRFLQGMVCRRHTSLPSLPAHSLRDWAGESWSGLFATDFPCSYCENAS